MRCILAGHWITDNTGTNRIVCKTKGGEHTPFNLSTLKSLTFAGSNVTVIKKEATTTSYVGTNVQYMNFDVNYVTESVPSFNAESSKLLLFPNPTLGILNISYNCKNIQNKHIEIDGIDGKTIIKNELDNNTNCISVASLPRGFYVCRLINGTKTETRKYIKQ